MTMPTALEIARQATLKPIADIAAEIGIPPWLIQPYGEHVAKIDLAAIEALADRPKAKYVVVTAVTPTPLGEGKTTTTVGLGQAMQRDRQARHDRHPAGARWGRRSGSRAARPAAGTARWSRSRR